MTTLDQTLIDAPGPRPTLRGDQRGAVLVYVALVLPVLIGIAGFAVDSGGLYTLSTDVQHAADAAALAGAKELNARSDAINRANAAVNTPANTTVFSSTTSVNIASTFFYRDSNAAAGQICDTVTADATLATCIQVTTETKSLRVWLVQVLGLSTAPTISATATAESRFVACSITPLMQCTNNTINFNRGVAGKQYLLTENNNGAWFGLVNPPAGVNITGNNGIRQAAIKNLAKTAPPFCFGTAGMTPATGNRSGPTADGMNVRFDIYPQGNPYGGELISTNVALEPPAPNAIAGGYDKKYGPNGCAAAQKQDQVSGKPWLPAYPRDNAFVTGASSFEGDSTSASQTWSKANYKDNNFALNNSTGRAMVDGATTRFGLYLSELGVSGAPANETDIFTYNQLNGKSSPANTTLLPSGFKKPPNTNVEDQPLSTCYADNSFSKTTALFSAARRIVYVAAVEGCDGNGNASVGALVAAKYIKMFVTEASKNGEIYAEYIKELKPGDDDNKFHQIVQLVR